MRACISHERVRPALCAVSVCVRRCARDTGVRSEPTTRAPAPACKGCVCTPAMPCGRHIQSPCACSPACLLVRIPFGGVCVRQVCTAHLQVTPMSRTCVHCHRASRCAAARRARSRAPGTGPPMCGSGSQFRDFFFFCVGAETPTRRRRLVERPLPGACRKRPLPGACLQRGGHTQSHAVCAHTTCHCSYARPRSR